jgi:hypothetical protein
MDKTLDFHIWIPFLEIPGFITEKYRILTSINIALAYMYIHSYNMSNVNLQLVTMGTLDKIVLKNVDHQSLGRTVIRHVIVLTSCATMCSVVQVSHTSPRYVAVVNPN